MPTRKYFSEQEVTRIIRRAVELQQTDLASKSEFTPGVSIDELERIAAEIGVSPEALARAVEEGSQGNPKKSLIRFRESYTRVINGELDPNDFDVVTSACRVLNTPRSRGAQQVGRNLTLRSWTGAGEAIVEVSSRKGRTSVQVTSSPFLPIMASLYPASIVAFVSGMAIGSHNVAAGLGTALALFVAGSWGTLRLLATNNRRSGELVEKVADAIDEHLEETGVRSRVSESASVKQETVSENLEENA